LLKLCSEPEIRVPPAVQRQIVDLLCTHDHADIGGLRLQLHCALVYLNLFLRRAHMHCEVNLCARLHMDLHRWIFHITKSLHHYFHRIRPGNEAEHLISSVAIRLCDGSHTCSEISYGDRRSSDDRVLLVMQRAGNGASIDLGRCRPAYARKNSRSEDAADGRSLDSR